MKKRALSLALALSLTAALLVPVQAAGIGRTRTYTPGQFTDVAADAWYADSVKDAYELGLMSGSAADAFNPAGMFTLAEAATIAARMHNLYNGGNGVLAPSAGAWYQSAVNYCVDNGIIAPGAYSDYTRNATRAEMAAIMATALPESAWAAKNDVEELPDVGEETPHREAIFQLYDAGVLTGSDDYGMFQPFASITRAEVAAIAVRCAEPAQRKTLALKPLNQREAVELPGKPDGKMAYGRLPYYDAETKLWGYLDTNGEVALPAQYKSAGTFENGHAYIENAEGCTYPIDPYGNTPFNFAPDGWRITLTSRPDRFIKGAIGRRYYILNEDGDVLISATSAINEREGYYVFWGRDGAITVADQESGNEIWSSEGKVYINDANLIKFKEGSKWGIKNLAGQTIVDAVYDYTDLSDGTMTVIKYGDLEGLAGPNGVIIEPGIYTRYRVSGDYAVFCDKESDYCGMVDLNGVVTMFDDDAFAKELKYSDAKRMAVKRGWYDWFYGVEGDYARIGFDAYNMKTGEYFLGWQYLSGGKNITIIDNTPVITDERDMGKFIYCVPSESGYRQQGPFGIWDGESRIVTGAIFDTLEEAQQALPDYLPGEYVILKNDAGKPYVGFGFSETGYTPVIEYYKGKLNYDEISDLGNGYYACLFNTTWYLVHV